MIKVLGAVSPQNADTLTKPALEFLAQLQRAFNGRRKELMHARVDRQARIEAGEVPDFLQATKQIRENDSWKVRAVR